MLANELLDNLPFRLAVHDGGWREAYVTETGHGTFAEVLPVAARPVAGGAAATSRPWFAGAAPGGAPVAGWTPPEPLCGGAGWSSSTTPGRPRRRSPALPWRSWLRTYRGHERGGGYLATPGDQDITADVALDQLPEPDAVRSQAHFLQRWGIDELVAEGRQRWAAAAAAPDLAALTMRSRVRDAEALLDADGLGAFTVAEWQRG